MAGNSKLEALRKREAEVKARIAAEEAKEKAKERKDETREKVLVGAGMLADVKAGKTNREGVTEILKRAIVAPKDREFLKGRGWNL